MEIPPILVIASVHGDEIESTWIANKLIEQCLASPILRKRKLVVVPCLNPDGALMGRRWNANSVDLNRNLPTSNWSPEATDLRYPPGAAAASEPETKCFLDLVSQERPFLVVSLHSFSKTLVLFPNYPANERISGEVQNLANNSRLPVVETMDYKVFGSLTGFGRENSLATVTLELTKGLSREETLTRYFSPFFEFINDLSGVE